MEIISHIKKIETLQTNIQLTKNSRLPQVNWNKLPFGRLFSHMFTMDYKNGKWSDMSLSYGNINLSPANSALHYEKLFRGYEST